jgi:hypothetical protein
MLCWHTKYILRHIEARPHNHGRRAKAISVTYSECVSVALFIPHAMRMRHIMFMASLVLPLFPHYLINGNIFGGRGGGVIGHKMCFSFSL